MKKRIIAFTLAFLFVFSALPAHASVYLDGPQQSLPTLQTQSCTSGFCTDYALTGDGATDMVSIALAQEGRTGGELGYTEEWCADFVCDCAIIASQSEAVPQYGGVAGLYDRILSAGGTEVSGDPQPGDLCFINWNGGTSMGHVEIVYQVTDGSVYTIGGNSGSADSLSDRWVKKHAPLSEKYILAILRPNYTAPQSYTVTYDANGGEGAPAAQEKTPAVSLTLSTQAPTREGLVFLGWSIDPHQPQVDYRPGDTYELDSDITLYAVWGDASCGEEVRWTLEDGTLTLSGTGAIYDWLDDAAPWYPLRDTITSTVIDEGITAIGIQTFYGCVALTEITIPETVATIADQAFFSCDALTDVFYGGPAEGWQAITIGIDNDPLTNATIHHHTHTYESVTTEPTCTEPGNITSTCTECGHTVVELLEATGHDYQDDICIICGSSQVKVPQILSCYSKVQTSVKVTWTVMEGVDGYELWRSTTPDDEASWRLTKTINDSTSGQYTNQGLTIGTTYYYRVRAFILDESGEKLYTDHSEPAYMPAAVVFDAPYSNATFRIRLRWLQIQGAHGYQIWRQNEDGSYSVVKTLGDKGNELTNDQGSTTAYSNCELTAGQNYTYKIRAFTITEDGRKIFGAYSDEYTVAVMPEAPTLTGESLKATRAQLNWNTVNGAKGYQIWVSDEEDGGYRIVKSITDGSLDQATIYDLVSSETYYLKIRAYVEIDGKKTFGAFSPIVPVTIQ